MERWSSSAARRPPGSAQRPGPSRQRIVWRRSSRTWSTTATVRCSRLVSCSTGFRFTVVNYRRKQMKKVVFLVVALVLLAAGSAGSGGAAHTKTLRIGMVTDVGGLNDHGFNHLAYVGLQEAQRSLGVKYAGSEAKSPADYIPNLATYARQGYDLVIGVGYTEIGAMGAVARRFPNTHFAIVDVANGDLAGKPKNVRGLLFREEQVGYLAGYLAGLETLRLPGRDVVSSVAGQKQPPVDRFIAGYQAGAKKANPNVKTLNSYSQDFNDQAKCKAIADNQIAAGTPAGRAARPRWRLPPPRSS